MSHFAFCCVAFLVRVSRTVDPATSTSVEHTAVPSTSAGRPPLRFPCAADLATGSGPPGGRRDSLPPERCRSAVGMGGSAPVEALLLSIRVGDLRVGVHWVVQTPWVGDAVGSPAYQVVLAHNLAVVHSQGVHIRVEGVRTQVWDRVVRTLGGSS